VACQFSVRGEWGVLSSWSPRRLKYVVVCGPGTPQGQRDALSRFGIRALNGTMRQVSGAYGGGDHGEAREAGYVAASRFTIVSGAAATADRVSVSP